MGCVFAVHPLTLIYFPINGRGLLCLSQVVATHSTVPIQYSPKHTLAEEMTIFMATGAWITSSAKVVMIGCTVMAVMMFYLGA
jgi:hypothetical protein